MERLVGRVNPAVRVTAARVRATPCCLGTSGKGLRSAACASSSNRTDGIDENRLALRLRLGENWRQTFGKASHDTTAAREALVATGRLRSCEVQMKAIEALEQLPGALTKGRDSRRKWDHAQAELTARAETAAARVRETREIAAKWEPGGWTNRRPNTPDDPAVVGPVCWLSVGPPPTLRPAGCYIHGSVGSGKSTIMDLFCLFGLNGWRSRRQHFHEFSLWVHETLHRLSHSRQEAIHKHVLARIADEVVAGIDVLFLDEFAVTNVADAAIIAELLQLLADRHVAVVCTTNRPPEDLYKDGLHRERYVPALVSHLRDDFLVVTLDGVDYREAMLRNQRARSEPVTSVFFEGGCADEAFAAAVGQPDRVFAPSQIKISWGRWLKVPGASGGIARFHFKDLCRTPLSAEDFMHLVTQFHTICVHDVPRLALEEHNEARRFTNFVDAVYEHSVKLVCHTNGPLEEVLRSMEALTQANSDGDHDAQTLGVFDRMYDDSPNFQIQIKELGSREKWKELQDRQLAEEQQAEAKRFARMSAPEAVEGDTGSGWSAAPATADLSSPDQGVAGVMVAAVGSLQESGFAARRAVSRLKEMQTLPYLEAAQQRRESMFGDS